MDRALEVGTFVVTLLGLGALFFQIRSAAKDQAEENARQKRQATLDAWNDPLAIDHRNSFWNAMPNDRDADAVRAFTPDAGDFDHPDGKLIVAYLNYYENFGVGVKHDIYDIDVINSIIGGKLVAAWDAYRPFVLERRRILSAPTIWAEFEHLAVTVGAMRRGE